MKGNYYYYFLHGQREGFYTIASYQCDLQMLTSRCLVFAFKPGFKINFWQTLEFYCEFWGKDDKETHLFIFIFIVLR